jgi:hypothetical protein
MTQNHRPSNSDLFDRVHEMSDCLKAGLQRTQAMFKAAFAKLDTASMINDRTKRTNARININTSLTETAIAVLEPSKK